MDLNKDVVRGKWKEIKGKVKQQWGQITDDELLRMEGTYDELQGLLQKKYGYEQERAREEIDTFLEENGWHKNH